MERSPRRHVLWMVAGLAALALAATFAPVAAATEPVTITFSTSGSFVLDDFCSFPVTFGFALTTRRTTFFDRAGNVVMRNSHIQEQDTFSANGITLTGLPYTANIHRFFDGGVLVKFVVEGVLEKVPLPDGRLFIVAGQGSDFGFIVDHGTNGDVAALCAALSP